jgi:MYXO-CTERM domain-containing protein
VLNTKKAFGILFVLLLAGFATPAASQTETGQTTTTTADDGGFDDWGLLGLLGLAGLLGRNKRDRTVTDTRRV